MTWPAVTTLPTPTFSFSMGALIFGSTFTSSVAWMLPL
jgi:hypothetical protein